MRLALLLALCVSLVVSTRAVFPCQAPKWQSGSKFGYSFLRRRITQTSAMGGYFASFNGFNGVNAGCFPYEERTYLQAEEFCTSKGARMCTHDELKSTLGSGAEKLSTCINTDNGEPERVWSSTPCEAGMNPTFLTVNSKTKALSCRDSMDYETASTVCCVDVKAKQCSLCPAGSFVNVNGLLKNTPLWVDLCKCAPGTTKVYKNSKAHGFECVPDVSTPNPPNCKGVIYKTTATCDGGEYMKSWKNHGRAEATKDTCGISKIGSTFSNMNACYTATRSEAEHMCQASGGRLCTSREVSAGVPENICDVLNRATWTSEMCVGNDSAALVLGKRGRNAKCVVNHSERIQANKKVERYPVACCASKTRAICEACPRGQIYSGGKCMCEYGPHPNGHRCKNMSETPRPTRVPTESPTRRPVKPTRSPSRKKDPTCDPKSVMQKSPSPCYEIDGLFGKPWLGYRCSKMITTSSKTKSCGAGGMRMCRPDELKTKLATKLKNRKTRTNAVCYADKKTADACVPTADNLDCLRGNIIVGSSGKGKTCETDSLAKLASMKSYGEDILCCGDNYGTCVACPPNAYNKEGECTCRTGYQRSADHFLLRCLKTEAPTMTPTSAPTVDHDGPSTCGKGTYEAGSKKSCKELKWKHVVPLSKNRAGQRRCTSAMPGGKCSIGNEVDFESAKELCVAHGGRLCYPREIRGHVRQNKCHVFGGKLVDQYVWTNRNCGRNNANIVVGRGGRRPTCLKRDQSARVVCCADDNVPKKSSPSRCAKCPHTSMSSDGAIGRSECECSSDTMYATHKRGNTEFKERSKFCIATQPPTQTPTTSGPTKNPTTSDPTRNPTTSEPTEQPTSEKETSSPTTGLPTKSPTVACSSYGYGRCRNADFGKSYCKFSGGKCRPI